MATTNLISKSLGDVLLQSGSGTPNHTASQGSLYTDISTGTLFINTSGGTSWQNFNLVSYGSMYFQDNVNATTISSTDTWVTITDTFTADAENGFSFSSNTLTLDTGYDGTFKVIGNATLQNVANSPNFEVGISIDSGVPEDGLFNGCKVSTSIITAHIGVGGYVDLTGGTTLNLAVRNITDTSNVIIKHAQLIAIRVK